MSDIPRVFGGKYRVERSLAQGGMGEVFLAVQEGPSGFSRQVVVKTLLPGGQRSPELVQMFQQEARLAALLSHPNIVHVYDYGEQDGLAYLVMEYVPGSSLEQLIHLARQSGQELGAGFVAAVGSQVCAGLAHAATHPGPDGRPLNLVHRDLSPQNVMLDPGGVARILDFGVARFDGGGARTTPGMIKGKPAYLSPEQCRQLPLDARSDLFSLGSVLWECCARRRLFESESLLELVQAIPTQPAPPLATLGVVVPAGLAAIIGRALELDPADRFQSAAEMGRACDAFLLGAGLNAAAELRATLARFVPGARPAPAPLPLVSPAGLRPLDLASPPARPPGGIPALDLSSLPMPGTPPRGGFVIEPIAAADETGAGLPWERTFQPALTDRPLELATAPEPAAQPAPEPATQPAPEAVAAPEPTADRPLQRPPPALRQSRGPSRGVLVMGGALLAGLAFAAWLVATRNAEQPLPPTDRPTLAEGLSAVRAEVTSQPSGARVFVDGVDSNKDTPASLTLETGREHTLELRHVDCLPHTTRLFAAPKQDVKLDATLTMGARIAVTTDPAGATILVDGKETFTAPGRGPALAPGKHVLIARLDGRAPESREFEVKGSEGLEWNVKLDPAVEVTVATIPPGATVLVDGKPTGVVTPGSVWARVGKKRLFRVQLEGYLPVVRRLDLRDGVPAPMIELTLEDAKAADLKGRISALEKKVAADERKLEKLQRKQSTGLVEGDLRRELSLDQQVEDLERSLQDSHAELGGLREDLDRLEAKAVDQRSS